MKVSSKKGMLGKSSTKLIIGVVIVIILAAAGWFAWAQWGTSNFNGANTTQVGPDSKHLGEPLITTDGTEKPSYDFSFKSDFKTEEQGNCQLQMLDSAGKVVLESQNSTVDKAGENGCQEWKLYTGDLPSGSYEIVVTFDNGKGNTLVSKVPFDKP